MRNWIAPSLFLLSAGVVFAQAVAGDPEVRRALPVDPENYDNPDWVQQVPRAIPVATPVPAPTPVPVATPIPVATPVASGNSFTDEPYRPPARPPAEATADEDGEGSIRIGPGASQSPGTEALDLANSLYARKMYDLAIPEYERFLISSESGSTGRDAAMFRVAECHRMLGNAEAARAGYERLVMEFQKGEFAGSGAYRLGEFLFGDKIYEAAAAQFETAAREAKDGEVRLTALYFAARSLDYQRRDAEAGDRYREIIAVEGKNPYRDHARMALAEIHLRAGAKDQALAAYEGIISDSKDSKMVLDAKVKAAALASESGQKDRALALYREVLMDPAAGDLNPVAVMGVLRLSYQRSDYKAVVGLAGDIAKLPDDKRAEALQLLAASYRQTGNNLDARRTYDILLKDFPDASGSDGAQFQRLVSLYSLKDKNLVAEIDAFLQKTTDSHDRTQALLLKAETLFKNGDYAAAGQTYEALLGRDLEPATRADGTYKLAWCLAATGDHSGAVSVYSDFLSKFPDHKLAATALAQRAISKQENKAFDSAIEDFDQIAAKYPGTKEHELALQNKALILGQEKKYAEMGQAFDELLREFPKSAVAGQANFWLGWAAFEQKDYKKAIERLDAARKLDGKGYGERATLRIILAYYYLEDRAAVMREADGYKGGNLPSEITLWLASHSIDEGNDAKAESLLLPLTANPAALPPDAWIQLAECQIRLGKFHEAAGPVDKFLATAREAGTRSRALLARSRVRLGLKQFDGASADADEALLLQPEGRLNAEGRLLQGDILNARGDYDAAARAYMTVSVLLNDPELTPRALQKAADAYKRANNRFESENALAELRKRFPDFQTSPKPKPKTKS